MKYVRTKDGRIVEVEEHMMIKETTIDGVQKCFRLVYKDRQFTCVLRGDEDYIIAQADTIVELCDRFVLSGIDIIYIDFEDMKYRFKDYDMWYDITETELRQGICGAIWTDKGLIYKAKMKGVLPNGEIDWELL